MGELNRKKKTGERGSWAKGKRELMVSLSAMKGTSELWLREEFASKEKGIPAEREKSGGGRIQGVSSGSQKRSQGMGRYLTPSAGKGISTGAIKRKKKNLGTTGGGSSSCV